MNAIEHFLGPLLPANPILQGLVGGIIISIFNTLGALFIFVWRNPSEKAMDAGLVVMLALDVALG